MDVLSDVLRVVHLTGAVYLDAEFTAPWCVISESGDALCSAYLPPSKHVVSFHLITEGICWAMLQDDRASAVCAQAGEILVIPQGESHLLGSDTNLVPVASAPMLEKQLQATPKGDVMQVRFGAGGKTTRMMCGFLAADNVTGNPLLAALPRLFKVDMRGESSAWLHSSLNFAAREVAATRAGSATVLSKLAELLFVEAIRCYLNALPEDRTGWLAGVRDRFVGRSLSLLHEQPQQAWTVDSLADKVGLSRSAFAQRFSALIGMPPIQYLARWRLQLAADRLRTGATSLAAVAESIGYDSESAFIRAFKREFGVPPATWRRGAEAAG